MRTGRTSTVLVLALAALLGCSSSNQPAAPGNGGGSPTLVTGAGGAADDASPAGGNGGASAGVTGAAGATTGASGSSSGGSSSQGGSGGVAVGDASVDPADGSTVGPPVPTRDEYLKTLYKLSDLLITTQISQVGAANYGALVSPSTNPDPNPIHSRGAEAVYPFAVAYKYSQDTKYADAAVRLGNWLITIQNAAGAWIEEWPAATGWDGTSADQLISMAGAYTILKTRLSAAENTQWVNSITRVADWVEANFPKGNVNYFPTGAVALVAASKAVATPKPTWLTKAASLMDLTLQSINQDNFITGEGMGVDLGYNIAQSIGMIAMYGKLLPSATHVDRAAALLKTHQTFMYPNGAIDNSWGTRNFKWTLESGTKTAPGVFFSFGLLTDKDPSFQRGAQLALSYFRDHATDDKGWEIYGPHAPNHATSTPPSNYSTFARAQSIAVTIELGPTPLAPGAVPADGKDWFKLFPTVATGVLRTDKIMATVTAYGADITYPRESMARGGSVSALWFEGYGSTGFMQVSSQTIYSRIEPLHMPIEMALLPLTPRVETISGTYSTNLYDDVAQLSMTQTGALIHATATGALKSVTGVASGTTFSWSYEFGAASYSKELQVSSPANLRIVEPFVNNPGNTYQVVGPDTFQITAAGGGVWLLKVMSSTGPYQLVAGDRRAQYWSPFPGLDAYPLTINLGPTAGGTFTIKYTVSQGP